MLRKRADSSSPSARSRLLPPDASRYVRKNHAVDVINRRVAGLDVHKRDVKACVRIMDAAGNVDSTTRTFGTMTDDLRNLRDWLKAQRVDQVAMESTGVYWKPVCNLLEDDFSLLLCNARHVKQVPGRKTDVKDCEWLAKLHQHGLLRGSFIPSRKLRELRDLTRTRRKILQERSRVANRIQAILEDANIKLSSVATDSLGASGRAMIRAIVDGETDPDKIADLAKRQLRGKIPQLKRALEGFVRSHHRFLLGLQLTRYEELSGHVDQIDERVLFLNRDPDLPLFEEDDSGPPSTGDSRQELEATPPDDDSADGQHGMTWNQAIGLLITIPGVSTRGAEDVLAEIGTDMSRFPSSGHLASWAGVCPGNNESGGVRKSGRATKGNKWLRSALVMAARGLRRTKGYLKTQYQRVSRRRGSMRAQLAVAHSILTAIWHMLTHGVAFHDLGEDYFDRRDSQKLTKRLVKRLETLGHEVSLQPQVA